MSDMSVSSQRMDNKVLSPLEPSSQQVFNESLSLYYRRGSLVDPQSNSRRPSIAEMGNLPLPNSKVASRRGSLVASNDFDLSSRSPSPSSLASMKRYHDNDGFSVNNYPMPHHVASAVPSYDAFQRRHSIAVAREREKERKREREKRPFLTTLMVGFRFPTSTQESNDYRTYSAPPSPPQTISNNVSYQEQLHENSRFNSFRRDNHLLTRRASMPVVPNQEQYLQKNSGLRKETPYSRSPELRVSHKLAERKRRKEMKDLFDELRDSLPVEKSTKTSKWEILSKAVEYISMLKRRDYDMENEIAGLRRELEMIKRSRG
ncbi:hypothetical protein EDC96DRAFT_435955 [Choanephora cucurbitarum]|nr:hypothetical protein EDC96DRAFT_435955 [Choanephora cucurbitarum]